MGVPGLWSLLEPARHPVELEQLAGKVIAIDMNIWLHQAVKSRAANAGPRTYLAILFRRLCKLIYFGIRPVFVFDGNVPALKQTTMAERRRHRGQLGDKAKRAQERLLHRLLRRVAEGSVTKSTTTPDKKKTKAGENDAGLELIRRLRQRPDVQQAVEDVELFRAPLDPSFSDLDSSGLLHTTAGLEYDDLARDYLDGFNLHAVGTGLADSGLDLNSDAFCALPLQAQLRVVQLAREQLDAHTHRSRLEQSDMADKGLVTENFSQHQIGRLLLRRRLAERHDQLSAELAREEAARQVARLNSPHLTATLTSRMEQSSSCHEQNLASSREWCTTALRIQSQDSGHAILIKKSPLKPLHGHNVKGRTHLTLESLIQLIHQAENEKIDDTRITSNSPTKVTASPTPDTDSSRSSTNVTTDSASDTTPMKSYRTNFASTVETVEDHRQFPQRVDRETAAIEAAQSRDILPPALSPPLVSSELGCSCTNKPEIPVEQKLPVSCSDRGSFLTDNHVEQTENSNSSLTDESTNLKSSASTFNVDPKTPTIIVDENSTNATTLVTEILTTSEEVCDIKLKVSPESDLVPDKNESDADDDDDDFVDVPVPDTVSIPVVEDVKDEIVDVTSPPSSQDSSSETTDVEADLKNQMETIPSVGENWVEDEESFTFDDDVLRDEADRLSRQAQTTTTKCIMEAQDLIKMFGMPFVISPEEAEAQCVTLQRTDLVDLVASDDSDVWPFGAQHVCRHLFGTVDESRSKGRTRLKSKNHTPSCYRLEDVQATLGLDVANILRLAMLCGSDYTPGIRNVGPVTAVEILSEFARQVPDPDAQDEQWTRWLCGMDAPDHLVGAVLEPLKQFVDWWHNCGSKTAGESKLVTSPVRRKWLNLRPPAGR
ncbi:DNA repair protein complementing XP-G cell [Fasciola gigantica]|uniref:DNA repair protein complementing XP-G cell n=1 Tax=Fasciola gigantica TaxID=46835 RepID=A0A504YVV1_FASGI|nr:DNA repair protein complementing XP-G cell [Fasciola gigantica]